MLAISVDFIHKNVSSKDIGTQENRNYVETIFTQTLLVNVTIYYKKKHVTLN